MLIERLAVDSANDQFQGIDELAAAKRVQRQISAFLKLMKLFRFPPGRGSAVMEASRQYRHYSPL
jgi:hypothetical protein